MTIFLNWVISKELKIFKFIIFISPYRSIFLTSIIKFKSWSFLFSFGGSPTLRSFSCSLTLFPLNLAIVVCRSLTIFLSPRSCRSSTSTGVPCSCHRAGCTSPPILPIFFTSTTFFSLFIYQFLRRLFASVALVFLFVLSIAYSFQLYFAELLLAHPTSI